jgi:hypothetical protein
MGNQYGPMYTWQSFRSKPKLVLLPTLLLISQIFVFGPAIIYLGNISEFDVSFLAVLKHYGIPALIIALIFLGIGFLLSRKYLILYISLIFAIAILLWIQGNILVWKYELSGGIDWSKGVWRGWIDGSLWIVVLVTTCFLYRHVYRIAILTSIVVLSLQLAYFGYVSIQNSDMWKKEGELQVTNFPPQDIFEFSSKQNVIHIILDEFQSTIFKEIIDEDIDRYSSAFKGFTFFEETTGSFPTTVMSIPAILSGEVYRNDVPIDEFIEKTYKGKTITNALYDSGYEVDFAVPLPSYCKGRHSHCYRISVPYGLTKSKYEKKKAALILNLVLFRYAPHFLKKGIYGDKIVLPFLKFDRNDTKQYESARHLAHRAFLQDLIDNMSVNRSRNVYKFIHLTTTHWPIVLDENCEYAGKILPFTWENIKVQTKCCFDHFIKLLEKLKLLGIYDSSFIILHADHGYWKIPDSANEVNISKSNTQIYRNTAHDKEKFAKIVCSALPLLSIKPPFGKGPLMTSSVQAALTDIPATISAVLDLNYEFKGRSVFDLDTSKVREREFRYYEKLNRVGDEYFDRMDEYIIKGSAFKKTSWHYVRTLLPRSAYMTQKINFGRYEDSRFLRSGWSHNEGRSKDGLTFNWALGSSASIFISFPKTDALLLTANMKTLKFRNAQNITIKVDGSEIGNWVLSPSWQWEKHSIVIKPDENRPDVSIVEFMFSQYRDTVEKDKRPLAVLFESITVRELKDKDKG